MRLYLKAKTLKILRSRRDIFFNRLFVPDFDTFKLFKNAKNPRLARVSGVLRGPERIRTAVAAFAELSLATRPSDHGVQM